MAQRGYRLTRPQAAVGHRKPFLDASGCLHFPAVLVYPVNMQQDLIEDALEGDSIGDHLDVMFGEGAPPLPWDEAREYARPRVELYYLSHAGRALPQAELARGLAGLPPGAGGDGEDDDEGPSRTGRNASTWVKARRGGLRCRCLL